MSNDPAFDTAIAAINDLPNNSQAFLDFIRGLDATPLILFMGSAKLRDIISLLDQHISNSKIKEKGDKK